MKSLVEYIFEQLNSNLPEYKEYDLEGKRKARTLSLSSENLISVKQKIDIALNSLKTGYFLRVISSDEIAMCFYNTPLEEELKLIIKLLNENKYTKYYIIKNIKVTDSNKGEALTITNFNQ